MPAPLVALTPQAAVIPHTYVIIKRSHHCLSCGNLYDFPELYTKSNLRSQWGHRSVTNLRPLYRPEYNLPIETLEKAVIDIPFCHECAKEESVMMLPLPPVQEVQARIPLGLVPSTTTEPHIKTKKTSTEDLLSQL